MNRFSLLCLLLLLVSNIQAQNKEKVYNSIEHALQNPIKVTSLSLKGQGLKTLPDELGKLINLESLDLSYNALTTIPTQLFKLPKLKKLFLNNNALTALPDLSALRGLTELRLDVNPFANPVVDLKKVCILSNLSILNFAANKLSAFPEELLKLSNLIDLDLGYGTIKTLPTGIDKLKNLKRLVLTKNLITAFPPAFFNLTKLENLDLSYCDFKLMPNDLNKLSLKGIDVSFNKNLSSIPALKDLRYINVKGTKLDADRLKWAADQGCIIMN